MIRSANVSDIWRGVGRKNYKYYINKVHLNGVLGVNEAAEFNRGVFSICGLNGVGKSTLLIAIKDSLGIAISDAERDKLDGIDVSVEVFNCEGIIEISNRENCRFSDIVQEENVVVEYIDFNRLVEVNNFLEQPNFLDFIEHSEEYVFNEIEKNEVSYLVGKTYDSITLREIEQPGDFMIPYFEVRCNDLTYNSLRMGTGEHFLFYVYWMLKKITSSGILLIEEPEVFISVNSQMNLMNFLGKKMNEIRFSVVLATHSPFILTNIKQENILVLHSYIDSIEIVKPESKEQLLKDLGLSLSKKGILIFEDKLALDFFVSFCKRHCSDILFKYSLEKTNGYTDINKILSIPRLEKMDYELIGVYDGDIRGTDKIPIDKLNWNFVFLPVEKSIEEEFQNTVRKNVGAIAEKMGISESEFKILLSKSQGKDYHDWLIDLSKEARIEFSRVVDIFFEFWNVENEEKVKLFITELNKELSE